MRGVEERQQVPQHGYVEQVVVEEVQVLHQTHHLQLRLNAPVDGHLVLCKRRRAVARRLGDLVLADAEGEGDGVQAVALDDGVDVGPLALFGEERKEEEEFGGGMKGLRVSGGERDDIEGVEREGEDEPAVEVIDDLHAVENVEQRLGGNGGHGVVDVDQSTDAVVDEVAVGQEKKEASQIVRVEEVDHEGDGAAGEDEIERGAGGGGQEKEDGRARVEDADLRLGQWLWRRDLRLVEECGGRLEEGGGEVIENGVQAHQEQRREGGYILLHDELDDLTVNEETSRCLKRRVADGQVACVLDHDAHQRVQPVVAHQHGTSKGSRRHDIQNLLQCCQHHLAGLRALAGGSLGDDLRALQQLRLHLQLVIPAALRPGGIPP